MEGTFKELGLEEVLKLVTPGGGGREEWSELPAGRSGYRQGLIRGELRVYHDGQDGMGVHLVAAGQGVRQLEAEGIVEGWEGPSGFAARLIGQGFQSSRVDVAMDERCGMLTPERIDGAITEGRCVSRFKQADPRQRISLKDGELGGWSVYLGAPSSRVRVRFYDKAAEQREKGHLVEGHWMRCELQARDERGDWVLAHLATVGPEALAGLVFNYVDFKEPGAADTNRSRWRTCAWWFEFLGEVEKRRCTVSQVVRSLESAAAWFQRQVAPTLALLWHSKQYGEEFILDMFSQGSRRLRDWQCALLVAPAPG